MTSIGRSPAQVSRATGYFVPLASLNNIVYLEPAQTANGLMSSFSTATWLASSKFASSIINTSGASYPGLLKDMGKTLVSAQRTFRKVQLVVSTTSTFGVNGDAGAAPDAGYLTGYIELGYEGYGKPAPVASVGR